MKTLRTLLITTATVASLGLMSVNAVQAQTNTNSQNRISWSQMTKQLEDKGYTIREIDHKADGWEVEVTDRNHKRLELRINSQGDIVSTRVDD